MGKTHENPKGNSKALRLRRIKPSSFGEKPSTPAIRQELRDVSSPEQFRGGFVEDDNIPKGDNS